MSERAAGLDDASWYEASARERIGGLLDDGVVEFIGPEQRQTSPHLAQFNLACAFDDGLMVGSGRLRGQPVLFAAQEGRFMGGTFGEVHGAKLVGLLRAAREASLAGAPARVLLALDTGGVRLQEANAGELAVSEIIRAICAARLAGVAVIALIGGRSGAFGGGGIIAACCSRIVISEQGRLSVTGPEVIETNCGVEAFDSRDRALVWRVTGGRSRRLLGGADAYVDDRIRDFREAAIAQAARAAPFSLATLRDEQARLQRRLQRFGACEDTPQIWRAAGIAEADDIADLPFGRFAALAEREAADAAR